MAAVRPALTAVERRCHARLCELYEARQGARGATVREVMAACGYAVPSTALATLRRLARKGYAEFLEGQPATWIPARYRPARFVPIVGTVS